MWNLVLRVIYFKQVHNLIAFIIMLKHLVTFRISNSTPPILLFSIHSINFILLKSSLCGFNIFITVTLSVHILRSHQSPFLGSRSSCGKISQGSWLSHGKTKGRLKLSLLFTTWIRFEISLW